MTGNQKKKVYKGSKREAATKQLLSIHLQIRIAVEGYRA